MLNYYKTVICVDTIKIKKINNDRILKKLKKSFIKLYKRDKRLVDKYLTNDHTNPASLLINNNNDGSNIVEVTMTIKDFEKIVNKYEVKKYCNNIEIFDRIVLNYFNIHGFILSILSLYLILSFQINTQNIDFMTANFFLRLLHEYQIKYFDELTILYENYKINKQITGDNFNINFKQLIKIQSEVLTVISNQKDNFNYMILNNTISEMALRDLFVINLKKNIIDNNKLLYCLLKKYNKRATFLL